MPETTENRSRSTGMTGHDGPESAVTLRRNQRSRCAGISGHVAPEYPSPAARACKRAPQPPARHRQLDMPSPAQGSRDVHLRPERKARDSSPPPIIHARLRHARASRGIRLGPAVFINQRCNLVRQFGAQTQVRRLLRRVGLRIPHAGAAFDLPLAHVSPLVSWAKRASPVWMSRFDVACAFFWKA